MTVSEITKIHSNDHISLDLSFQGDRIQWNFLTQTATSGCEAFL